MNDGWSFWDDYEERNSEPGERSTRAQTATLPLNQFHADCDRECSQVVYKGQMRLPVKHSSFCPHYNKDNT